MALAGLCRTLFLFGYVGRLLLCLVLCAVALLLRALSGIALSLRAGFSPGDGVLAAHDSATRRGCWLRRGGCTLPFLDEFHPLGGFLLALGVVELDFLRSQSRLGFTHVGAHAA